MKSINNFLIRNFFILFLLTSREADSSEAKKHFIFDSQQEIKACHYIVFPPEIISSILAYLGKKHLSNAGNASHQFQALSEYEFSQKAKGKSRLPSNSQTPERFSYCAREFVKKGAQLSCKRYDFPGRRKTLKKIHLFFKGHNSYLQHLFWYLASEGPRRNDVKSLEKYIEIQKIKYRLGYFLAREIEFALTLQGNFSADGIKRRQRSLRSQGRLFLLIPQIERKTQVEILWDQAQNLADLEGLPISDYYISSLEDKKCVEIYNYFGNHLKNNKKWHQAIIEYSKILAKNFEITREFHHNYAFCLMRAKKIKEAAEQYSIILEKKSQASWKVNFYYGICLSKLKKWHESEQQFKIACSKEFNAAWYIYAYIETRLHKISAERKILIRNFSMH